MPYKTSWIVLMILSFVVFGWWDEVAIWAIGVSWNWWIIPVYYVVEYGIMLPLTLLLAKKTFRKLGVKTPMRQVAKEALKNSLPVKIWKKIRRNKLTEQEKLWLNQKFTLFISSWKFDLKYHINEEKVKRDIANAESILSKIGR